MFQMLHKSVALLRVDTTQMSRVNSKYTFVNTYIILLYSTLVTFVPKDYNFSIFTIRCVLFALKWKTSFLWYLWMLHAYISFAIFWYEAFFDKYDISILNAGLTYTIAYVPLFMYAPVCCVMLAVIFL